MPTTTRRCSIRTPSPRATCTSFCNHARRGRGRSSCGHGSSGSEATRTRVKPSFDVAVIGGGLVGSAIAYGLARLQRRVVLLDEGDVAFRAARGNFGLVWVQGKGLGLPRYGDWTQLSARRWPEL